MLADRYIASNLAHQGARVPPEQREEFIAWLKQLEYGVYGLPAEDLVLYLRVPAAEAHRLAGERGAHRAREYTNLRRDLQESDIAHLEAASSVYDEPRAPASLGENRMLRFGLRHASGAQGDSR